MRLEGHPDIPFFVGAESRTFHGSDRSFGQIWFQVSLHEFPLLLVVDLDPAFFRGHPQVAVGIKSHGQHVFPLEVRRYVFPGVELVVAERHMKALVFRSGPEISLAVEIEGLRLP